MATIITPLEYQRQRNTVAINDTQYTTFAAALSQIGSSNVKLEIKTLTDVLTTTIIPPGTTLRFDRPGAFSIATGVTLTILGPIDPLPNHQVFQGPGTVSFGKVDTVNGGITSQGNAYVHFANPVWWGAQPLTSVNDITTDSTSAFQAALDSHKSVYIPEGFWNLKNVTMNGFAQALYSNGFINTKVVCIATSGTAISINATDCAVYGFYLSGTLSGSNTNYTGIYQANGGIIKDMFIDQFHIGIGVGSGGMFAYNVTVDPCSGHCIYMSGAQTSNLTNFIISPASSGNGITMVNSCVQNFFSSGIIEGSTVNSTSSYGVKMTSTCTENTFSDINLKNFGASGFYMDGTCNNNSIQNCQIRSNAKVDSTHKYGVEVWGRYNRIIGNIIWDDAISQLQTYGVFLASSSVSNIVTSNILRGNATGAYSDNGATNVVSQNITS